MNNTVHQYRLTTQIHSPDNKSPTDRLHLRLQALEKKHKTLEQNLQFAAVVIVTLGTGLALYLNRDSVSEVWNNKLPDAQQIKDSFFKGWEWIKGCFSRPTYTP